MRTRPKQVIIIDQESDIDSDSSDSKMQIEQNTSQISNKTIRSQQDMYQKFASSNYFMLTQSFKRYGNQISDFLENVNKKILFVFGPSGCGKATLVRKVLEHNDIFYSKLQEYEDDDGRIVQLGGIIIQSLQKKNSNRVSICFDFPISVDRWNMTEVREFKCRFSQQTRDTITKTIFILNEQIYNSFYILNERASSQENLNNRENVTVIKMEKFGVFEMKKILKGFVDHEKLYGYVSLGKEFLEEVIEVSSGDLRKALNMLYWNGVETKADKILKEEKTKVQTFENEKRLNQQKQANRNGTSKKQQQQIPPNTQSKIPQSVLDFFDQQDQLEQYSISRATNSLSLFSNPFSLNRNKKPKLSSKPINYSQFIKYKSSQQKGRCSLYHGLGKLLYGKRLNIRHLPKNKKEISCYYTEREINELDPPFYFDPVAIVEQLRVEFDIVAKLLQENYLERFGKVRDVARMADVFRMYDSFFSYKNGYEDEEVKEIKVKLVAWGMLIYNKNSRTDNMGFRKIEKSESSIIDRKVRQKKRLIRQYFPTSTLSNLLTFAHYTRTSCPPSLLHQTLFNKAISRQHLTKVDDHTKTLNEEEEEQIQLILKTNNNDIENRLRDFVKQTERKKEEMAMLFEELEEEDEEIDQIENQ